MIDVSEKADTRREAIASGILRMQLATLERIRAGTVAKGDVLAVADVAAVMAAKHTPDLIPMCHNIFISGSDIDFEIDEPNSRILIAATVKNTGQTGVEMEALTAVSVAALTIYDMCKAVDKEMTIEAIYLAKKTGGKSGEFINPKHQ